MLVDGNVVLDLVTSDLVWGDWSNARIDETLSAGPLFITDVVHAELAVRYARMDDPEAWRASACSSRERRAPRSTSPHKRSAATSRTAGGAPASFPTSSSALMP